ncbi:hypothetical protein K3725_13975 [Leisingera sp. S132]|uniref:hypothetical protein n=1 Tax=Leisingera sp. S132 TaxID=2867016 RepID=UPI0021A3B63D|nr:hypothetical protein [Leisingera sp. S132]UWQ78410.1 hypothetical protein K3725_13975 [Leisingera sp. S132]
MGRRDLQGKNGKPVKATLPADHEFAELIAEAYRVFAAPKPAETGVCKGCCMDPSIEADFLVPDIADLPLHFLQDWYFAAVSDAFGQNIWRYLLPRVLEVLASGEELAYVGLEVSLNRFPTGDAARWKAAEWAVLDKFQRMYLDWAVRQGEDCLDDVLCMFGIAGWRLEDLFAQVLDIPAETLAERLWRDWCIGRPSIWITAFWDNGGNSAAFAFYTSPVLYWRMADLALDDRTRPEIAEKALAVAGVIEQAVAWDAGG